MVMLVQKRLPHEDLQQRRREVELCLAEFGLTRGPRRLSRETAAAWSDPPICRLRAALQRLGPVFTSFGIYLSSRVDLLPVKDCLELAVIPDRAQPSLSSDVWQLVEKELRSPPEKVFAVFEERPFESRLMFQWHYGWRPGGEAVVVKVIHPEVERQIERDAPLLPLLKGILVNEEWADLPIEDALRDFSRLLRQYTDFADQAEMMAMLGQEARDAETFRMPMVHKDLCSSKVLTLERLPGTRLDDLLSTLNHGGPGAGPATHRMVDPEAAEGDELASRLCQVWLRQALQGRLFPVEPRPDNILVLPKNQIAFTGGLFAGLPVTAKTTLRDYLVAASIQNPDAACSYMLQETKRAKGAISEDDLRHRFRQVVPFRDGGWSQSSGNDTFAEHLFVQWRFASRHGYWPRLHLLNFYRGLFLTADAARRLAPGRDVVLEALEDFRLNTVLSQFREMITLGQVTDSMGKYAMMMIDLPKKLDEALTQAAEGRVRLNVERGGAVDHDRKNSLAVMVSLLLLLAAVALWSHHLAASAAWVDRLSAVAFVLIGALLLRVVTRAR
jgi:predicted unusual protein kinase regulating ubiquinone biosynthesis (AarF/ABC1/UbiB family)